MDGRFDTGIDEHDIEEVTLVARGIATAVAPETGLTAVQAELLEAIAAALTGSTSTTGPSTRSVPSELAEVLAARDLDYRQRIVHHMVLGELVLRPIPVVVAHRVAKYAEALGMQGQLRARRPPLRAGRVRPRVDGPRNAAASSSTCASADGERGRAEASTGSQPADVDPALEARWQAFAELPPDTLGYAVWDMYDSRGFALPGAPGGAPPYLAQHDFVHVLADYGTNLQRRGGGVRAHRPRRPRPAGLRVAGDARSACSRPATSRRRGSSTATSAIRVIQAPGMHLRVADAIRRGKMVWQQHDEDLFDFDYHDARGAARSTRSGACSACHRSRRSRWRRDRRRSPRSRACRRRNAGVQRTQGRRRVNRNFTQTISVRCSDPADRPTHRAPARSGTATRRTPTSWGTWASASSPTARRRARYLIVADFGVVDPDVPAADEAARNNQRPETQATAAAMRAVLDEDPVYRDYDWEYLTDG